MTNDMRNNFGNKRSARLARKPVGELRNMAHRQGVINVSRLPKDELVDILSW